MWAAAYSPARAWLVSTQHKRLSKLGCPMIMCGKPASRIRFAISLLMAEPWMIRPSEEPLVITSLTFFSGIVFFRSVDKRQGIVVFGQGMVYAAHNVKHMRIPISSIFLQIGKIDNIGSSTILQSLQPGSYGV